MLELKDKVGGFAGGVSQVNLSITNQVENALQGLGYSAKEAALMVAQISSNHKIDKLELSEILKLALKSGAK